MLLPAAEDGSNQPERQQEAATPAVQAPSPKARVQAGPVRRKTSRILLIALAEAYLFVLSISTRGKKILAACSAALKARWQALADAYRSRRQRLAASLNTKTASWGRARQAWRDNQHFTLLFIPANGQNVAKKHLARKHLKRSLMGVGLFLAALIGSFGYLAQQTFLNQVQKRELAEFKQTKQAQEETIQRLEEMAEKNQKELAQIHQLEEEVRKQMAKSGISLPPKNESAASAQGGPVEGTTKLSVTYAQTRNITWDVAAKKADFKELLSAIKRENYRKDATPSLWPTDGGEITSYFGYRSNPFDGYSGDFHPGVDIATYYGAPVYATAAGYVQEAGWNGGYGRYIRISHDSGYDTAYGHMSSIATYAGAYVEKGEVIGYVGSSGYSTGPHVHYEVIDGSGFRNPLRFVN